MPSFELAAVENISDRSGDGLGDRESYPGVIKPYLRQCPEHGHEAEYLPCQREQQAHRSPAYRLEEHREHQRKHSGNKAASDYRERLFADCYNLLRIGENAQKLRRQEDEANNADNHERKGYEHRFFHRFSAPGIVIPCKVEAYDRHDAGLKPYQRNEEEALRFVIEPEDGDRRIREAREYHVEHYNIYRIEHLRDYRGIAVAIYPRGANFEFIPLWRLAETLDSYYRSGDNLARDGRICGARNAERRDRSDAKDEYRVEHNICQRSDDLRYHRQAHISARLMHLRPVALEKSSDAADAGYSSVGHRLFDSSGLCRARHDIRAHNKS